MSWAQLWALIAAVFAITNVFFAFAYMVDGGVQNARPGNFADVLFFIVETMVTIGSGTMAARSTAANVLFSAEATMGLIGFALLTGLAFAKFSGESLRRLTVL
jgi:inward rectifier potassium channel